MDSGIRKRKILDIILKAHIETGLPVGSRYISNIMGLSSATIRNIVADLEEEGYVNQPHISAGRIPTERAYRLYVNTLLDEKESNPYEIKRINDELFSRYHTYSEIMEHASYLISNLTNYTSFVIYPKRHIYMDGVYHMLEQPEFNTLSKAKMLLKALDEKDKLLSMMNTYISTGTLKIHIGKENQKEEFESCSIVTASYRVRKKIVGGLGIIGPVRMKYKRVVPLVRYLADSFSRMLERII